MSEHREKAFSYRVSEGFEAAAQAGHEPGGVKDEKEETSLSTPSIPAPPPAQS